MKHLFFLLLLAGAGRARAQAPNSAATRWHWGESARAATDRVLSRPGWVLKGLVDQGNGWQTLRFASADGRAFIERDLLHDATRAIRLTYPAEAAGAWVVKGTRRQDDAHWLDTAGRAHITRLYNGPSVVYRIEYSE